VNWSNLRVEGRADASGAIVYPDVETALPPGWSPGSPSESLPRTFTTVIDPGTGIALPLTPSRSVEQSPVAPFGNSVIRNDQGGIKRCWTNEWGVTSCD